MHVFADSCGSCPSSEVVDLYSTTTGVWSTAQFISGRSQLAAASVGDVAVFAGGQSGGV